MRGVVHLERFRDRRVRNLQQLPVQFRNAGRERTDQRHRERSHSTVRGGAEHDDLITDRNPEIARQHAPCIRFRTAFDVSPLCQHVGQTRQCALRRRFHTEQLRPVTAVVAGDQRKCRDSRRGGDHSRNGADLRHALRRGVDRAFDARIVEVTASLQLNVAVEQTRRVVHHRGVRAGLHRHRERQ